MSTLRLFDQITYSVTRPNAFCQSTKQFPFMREHGGLCRLPGIT